ncbi:MAG TPA: fused MFS/spermidine synthase, partial [Opitutus sp.]|nr:fused MFS/spermidine synthase [Opitutus sp.]
MSAASLNPRPELRSAIHFVPLLLFVSGALALVYEIVWQREFALVFGSAAPATAAVLAAYFAGLGLGALVIGRVAKQWSRPLRTYAVLEVLVGVGALLVSPLLKGFEWTYPLLVDAFSAHPAGFMAVRIVAAFVILMIPTFCMGGTLPVLGELVDRSHQRLGLTVGWLYIVNTVGAGIGALLVPFLLMRQLGLNGTVALCAALNGVLAIVAWSLDRRHLTVTVVDQSSADFGKQKKGLRPSVVVGTDRGALGLALISGAVTFALQVLWNRAFAQVHENSMYSFAVIVAVVIFALAIGGQLARMGLRRGIEPGKLIGGAWLMAGVIVVIGPWLFVRMSNGLSYLPTGSGWMGDSYHLIRLAGALLLIPMALLGVGL